MHELSVTESLLQLAERYAAEADAARVTDLYLVIGRLSSIVDDSVQFYWDIISQDTICAGAALHFERVPATILCRNCNEQYTLEGELIPCPNCASTQIKITAGEEFRLDSITIEEST